MNNTVFFHLLWRDLTVFRREYIGKLIDTLILFITVILVFGTFMSGEGLSSSYGPFILLGAIGSFGLIEVVGKIGLFMSDIEGERAISQILIMPIRSNWVFVYKIVFWALSSMLLSVVLFFVGKLFFWERFDLSKISYIRLIPIYLTANIFFGAFALWLTSILRGMSDLNSLWQRFIAPMWMFGAYFFRWESAYTINHIFGIILLANPMTYVMEGTRAAALGQEGFLPYWVCLVVLWVFIFACATQGIKRLKRKLDCV